MKKFILLIFPLFLISQTALAVDLKQKEAWNNKHDYNNSRFEILYELSPNVGSQVGWEGELALFNGRLANQTQVQDVLCPIATFQNSSSKNDHSVKLKSFTNTDLICSYTLVNGDMFDFKWRKSYYNERLDPKRIEREKAFFGIDELAREHEIWQDRIEDYYSYLSSRVKKDVYNASQNPFFTLSNVFTGIITLDDTYALGTDSAGRLILSPTVKKYLSEETLDNLNLTQLGMIWDVSVKIWEIILNFAFTIGAVGLAYIAILKPGLGAWSKKESYFSEMMSAWTSSKGLLAALATIIMIMPISPSQVLIHDANGKKEQQYFSFFQLAVQYFVQTGNVIANELAIKLDGVVQENLIKSVKEKHLQEHKILFESLELDIPLWITAIDDHRICMEARQNIWLKAMGGNLKDYPNGAKITYEACEEAQKKMELRKEVVKNNVEYLNNKIESTNSQAFKGGLEQLWVKSSKERLEYGWWQIVTNFPSSSLLATKFIGKWADQMDKSNEKMEAELIKRSNLNENEDEVKRMLPDKEMAKRDSKIRDINKNIGGKATIIEGLQLIGNAAFYHFIPGFTGFANQIGELSAAAATVGAVGANETGSFIKAGSGWVAGLGGGLGAIAGAVMYIAGTLLEWSSSMAPLVAKIIANITAMEIYDNLLEAVVVTALILSVMFKILLWILQLIVTILVSPLVVFYSYYVKNDEVIKTLLSRTAFVALLYPALIVVGGTLAWAGIFLIDMVYNIIFSSALAGLKETARLATEAGQMHNLEEFGQVLTFYAIGSILLKILKIIWVVYVVFRLPTWLEKQLGMEGGMDISNWSVSDVSRGFKV